MNNKRLPIKFVLIQKIATADHSLRIDRDIIHSVASVRVLGVTLDNELTLQRHVNKVASACFYHIRRLKKRSADCLDLTLRPVLFLRSC